MRTRRMTTLGLVGLSAGLFSVAVIAGGQQGGNMAQGNKMTAPQKMEMGAPMTKAQKIASARSAAPAAISAKATIYDYPAKEGQPPVLLEKGTNGWNCFPDMAETKGNDPMCLDESWMKWMDGYMSHKAPAVTRTGIAYMIAPGGGWGSNTDPYGMTETATNQWALHEPHLMILVPDLKALEGVSTDPKNGGPYVMYAGTPYAHIMAPVKK